MALSSTFIFETKWKNTGNTISKDSLTIHAWSVRFFLLFALFIGLIFSLLHEFPGNVSTKCPQTS